MISVIIPLYNAENTIVKALDSVKKQTYKEQGFEIIIINDGSTDESKNIVENYISQNLELNIQLLNQDNKGVSAARNAGLKICKGEFIALLDSDDEWFPEKTERQMLVFKNNDLEIDYLSCRRTNHEISFPYFVRENYLAKITFQKLLVRNESQPSTVIFKRKIIENGIYFNENQRYAEDLNYWLKVSEYNTMFILNEELVIAGNGKRTFGVSGLSSNLKEMEKGFQKNLKEMWQEKRIGFAEYILYFLFYKGKYIFRISRNQYLKLHGK